MLWGHDPSEGIMGWDAVEQGEKGLEPGALALAKEFHILEAFSAGQQSTHSDDENIEQVTLLRPRNTWVLQSLEMRDDRRVHGDSHGACSFAEGFVERSIAEAVQGYYDAITLAHHAFPTGM